MAHATVQLGDGFFTQQLGKLVGCEAVIDPQDIHAAGVRSDEVDEFLPVNFHQLREILHGQTETDPP